MYLYPKNNLKTAFVIILSVPNLPNLPQGGTKNLTKFKDTTTT
ncbi:hypothetical protein C900_00314 [Fulvivirga imtechensis AK7]|uniref:Uncharacterized protein n=1 Tax=Fulvivirga imtechensis AK7 TaxID=1237149 RepID=L8JI30_9BACT|nr:hypothetical protein C900_00314 [Fulvivirga imtechensis AK7]